MDHTVLFDADLIRHYEKPGPRYTSYPTAVQFHPDFREREYRKWAEHSNGDPIPRPLSLYFHLPFCSTICYYCACNKVITKNRARALPYLERLHREIALQGALFDHDRVVDQLHWGGGTPTFLSHDQMRDLMRVTAKHFNLHSDDSGEYSIEIDPRGTGGHTVALLREIGFNRLSIGVQDFDPKVQRAVNRIQSEEETIAVVEAARHHGFKSVSMDLIYGLPFQSVESFESTLEKVIAIEPDRLALFNYAHLPEVFKPQRRINEVDLPSPPEKLAILQHAIERLSNADFVYIGMDHFARPDDELARAQRKGTLQRNFQGYSTHADCDLIGMGPSAIGKVGNSHSQNVRDLDEYCLRIDRGELPILRGIELRPDDRLRREVIMQIICQFNLDIRGLEEKWGIRFGDYFRAEQPELRTMQSDGLLVQDAHHLRVLPAGRLLVRNTCMVFDRYLRERKTTKGFSMVI